MTDLPPENPATSMEAPLQAPARQLMVKGQQVEQSEDKPYQQAARGRLVVFPFAFSLIGLGALLIVEPNLEGFKVTPALAAVILLAGFVLTNLFRFFASGRRERGLFFLALVILALGVLLAITSLAGAGFDLQRWWPLFLLGAALALFFTFVAERQHERGLTGATLLMLLIAGVALLVTHDLIPDRLIDVARDYFPLLIAFLGVTLVPLALRRAME